ncbi:MAG TPA: hypothetical protein VKV80_08015 [Streptosporangiaceae bacterium]|nr:hypothetical protein [Streptosporangiaceae bacterium]
MSALASNPGLGKLRAAWNWTVSHYGQPHSAEAEFSGWWRACSISPYHSACTGQFGTNFSGLNLNYSFEGAFHAGGL